MPATQLYVPRMKKIPGHTMAKTKSGTIVFLYPSILIERIFVGWTTPPKR
jgi:hypothetical protein